MNKYISILVFLIVASLGAADFTVTSPTLKNGEALPNKHVFNSFGCTGENISPALKWANAPAGTKSFAVTVYDPDAPTGSGWWHWTVVNIPATVTELKEGASTKGLPAGAVQGRTDFGKPGFGGACPPAGDKPHRYIITVYALKADKLDVNKESSGALVGFNINFATLAKAVITPTYSRPAAAAK
jgi:Raf kinase inhibitor-like YbhB/YbcL family protein